MGAGDTEQVDPLSPRGGVRAVALSLVAVALLVVFDQWSKAYVFDWIRPGLDTLVTDIHGHRQLLIHGRWLSFMTSCNPGAAFGQFGSFPGTLVSLRVVAVLFLTWLVLRADTRQRTVLVAMVLVLSGALGNVIDNLWTGCMPVGCEDGAPYGVRDFISVWFEPLIGIDTHFPSFNVADSCISVGAVLWVLSGMFHSPEPEAASGDSAEDGSLDEDVEGVLDPSARVKDSTPETT